MVRMNFDLSPHDVRRLCAAGALHPDTVRRCYSGAQVRSTSYARIVQAARDLALPLPPPPRPQQTKVERK